MLFKDVEALENGAKLDMIVRNKKRRPNTWKARTRRPASSLARGEIVHRPVVDAEVIDMVCPSSRLWKYHTNIWLRLALTEAAQKKGWPLEAA